MCKTYFQTSLSIYNTNLENIVLFVSFCFYCDISNIMLSTPVYWRIFNESSYGQFHVFHASLNTHSCRPAFIYSVWEEKATTKNNILGCLYVKYFSSFLSLCSMILSHNLIVFETFCLFLFNKNDNDSYAHAHRSLLMFYSFSLVCALTSTALNF